MRKYIVLLLALLALPVFLFIYQPSWQLGGLGMLLGFIGMTISPLVILFALGYWVKQEWNK
ncbi:MAG: hypothetical protein Q7S89_00310 [bacterium]|nr:hypothetical protein [bacterium]